MRQEAVRAPGVGGSCPGWWHPRGGGRGGHPRPAPEAGSRGQGYGLAPGNFTVQPTLWRLRGLPAPPPPAPAPVGSAPAEGIRRTVPAGRGGVPEQLAAHGRQEALL